MPVKLPTAEDLGDAPKLISGRPIDTVDYSPIAAGGDAIGKALQSAASNVAHVGKVLGMQAEKEKNEDAYTQQLQADANFKTQVVQLDSAANDINDPDKLNEHKARYEAARQGAAAAIQDPKLREQWLLKNQPAVANDAARIDSKIARVNLDNDLAALDTNLYTMKQEALKQPNPAEAQKAIDAAGTQLDAAVAAGKIDATKAVTMKRAWAQDVAEKFLTTKLSPGEQIGVLRGAVDPKDKNAILDRIGGVESGNNDHAQNPTSSAGGRFQFIDSTWLRYVKQYRPDLAAGKSDGAIIGMKGDGALSREMAGRLLDNNAAALKDAGVPVTPGTLYLAHFAGVGDKDSGKGAIGLLQVDPSTPVSEIFSPKAIQANRSVLAGKTAGQVVAWADRKMGVDNQYTPLVKLVPEERRQMLLADANKTVQKQEQQDALVTREEATTVSQLMKRDEAQVAANGTPIQDLTPERVEASHGPEAKQEFLERRAAASDFHDQTSNWSRMTPDEITASVARLDPKPYEGTGTWNIRQEYYDKARQAAADAIQQRRDDPAAVVAADPQVDQAQKAYEQTNGQRPQDFRSVVQARLDAQERIGVSPDMRRVATGAEVDHYASILRPMAKGQIEAMEQTQQTVINNAIDEIFTKYGQENAQQVLTAILSKVTLSKEAGEIASSVVTNARNNPYGPVIPAKERQALQQLQTSTMIEQATATSKRDRIDEQDLARKAIPSRREAFSRSAYPDSAPAAAPATQAAAPQAAAGTAGKVREIVDWAMKDPDKNIPQVVKQYGPDLAKRILGPQYEAHLFRMKQQGQ